MYQIRAGSRSNRGAPATFHLPTQSPPHFCHGLLAVSLPLDAEVGTALSRVTRICLDRHAPVEMVMGRMGIQRLDSAVRAARSAVVVAACLVLANCASSGKFAGRVDPKYGVSSSPRVVAYGDPVPKVNVV